MPTILLSLPGLRRGDLDHMPRTRQRIEAGDRRPLKPHAPCVTWPVQANVITGKLPRDHGVVANGFYWRDRHEVEMWTAGNEVIEAPQIWDRLHELDPPRRSAVWFPMLSKRCGADYVCMPAPVHHPDGSESLWCYTKPEMLYGDLMESLGHFPLQHFWGPLANIESSQWIARSAAMAFGTLRPDFFFIYLPHLDYAAQKHGPQSDQAMEALRELDEVIGELATSIESAGGPIDWLVVGEYAITEVSHVVYPNRVLRQRGWLEVAADDQGKELIDLQNTTAWALVDHQFSHVYVRENDASLWRKIADSFASVEGIAEVLVGDERARYALDHPRSGEIVLISDPDSWQAYYWWLDDSRAPDFARTVDIHRKPGYDPVELFFDPATRSIPLDATLVRGSHGAPADRADQLTEIACSRPGVLAASQYDDTDVACIVEQLVRG